MATLWPMRFKAATSFPSTKLCSIPLPPHLSYYHRLASQISEEKCQCLIYPDSVLRFAGKTIIIATY